MGSELLLPRFGFHLYSSTAVKVRLWVQVHADFQNLNSRLCNSKKLLFPSLYQQNENNSTCLIGMQQIELQLTPNVWHTVSAFQFQSIKKRTFLLAITSWLGTWFSGRVLAQHMKGPGFGPKHHKYMNKFLTPHPVPMSKKILQVFVMVPSCQTATQVRY